MSQALIRTQDFQNANITRFKIGLGAVGPRTLALYHNSVSSTVNVTTSSTSFRNVVLDDPSFIMQTPTFSSPVTLVAALSGLANSSNASSGVRLSFSGSPVESGDPLNSTIQSGNDSTNPGGDVKIEILYAFPFPATGSFFIHAQYRRDLAGSGASITLKDRQMFVFAF